MLRLVSSYIRYLSPSSDWNPKHFVIIAFSAIVVGILAFFYEISNSTIGIDDYTQSLSVLRDHVPFLIGRGTWGLWLLHMILPGPMIVPVVHILISIVIQSLTIVSLFVLWDLSKKNYKDLIVAASIYVSFPYFAAQVAFSYYQVGYSLSNLLMVVALSVAFHGNGILRMIFSISCFVLSIAMYQGAFSVMCTVIIVTIIICIVCYDDDNNKIYRYKNNAVKAFSRLCLSCLLGGVFYMILQKIIERVTGYSLTDAYHVGFQFDFWLNHFQWVRQKVLLLILGENGVIPSVAMILFLVSFCLVIVSVLFERNRMFWNNLLIGLLVVVSIFSPFAIVLIHSGGLNPRSSLGLAIVWVSVFVILLSSAQSLFRMWGRLAGIAVVIVFVFHVNSMFYSQHLVYQADRDMMNRIVGRIVSLSGVNQLDLPIPVSFVGNYQHTGNQIMKHYKGTVLGASQFRWDGGNPKRMGRLAEFMGITEITIEGGAVSSGNFTDKNKASILEHKPWPSLNSVFIDDERVVVWLGKVN